MRRFIASAVVSLLLFAAAAAHAAGQVNRVTITQVKALSTGQYFVYFSAPIAGGPACATSTYAFVFDGTTAAGKTFITVAQMALAVGSKVTAGGLNTCGVFQDYETLGSIAVAAQQ